MPTKLLPRFIPALLLTLSPISPAQAGQSVAANAPAPSQLVRIDNFTFTPAEITVTAGTVVTWINRDDIPHTVAATDHTFRSKAMDTDQQYTFTFADPGTYEYFCALHPHMQGRIIVK
jgi:amicyanin